MQKIIVFDFDKTLSVKDTNLLFFKFVGRTKSFYYLRLLIYIGFVVFRKLRLISNIKLKNTGLFFFINGKTEEEIIKLSYDFSQSIKLNDVVVGLLNSNIENNNRVIVVTASVDTYVKSLFPKTEVIGSLLDYEFKMIRLKNHCYQEEKINRLLQIGVSKIDTLYTDSISDLPLAKISDTINLVKKTSIIECRSVEQFINSLKE